MKRFFILMLLVILGTGALHAQTIRIVTDQNTWYPYSYEDKGASKGLHIDIVTQVLKNIGYSFSFRPLPWKRCLYWMETGKFDAVISASYQLKRVQYLYYPEGATAKKAKYRITQVEYSIITCIDSPYQFNGDVKSLPTPVRAPRGYSVIDDLKKENIIVDEGTNTIINFMKLLRDRKGCVITLQQNAVMLMKRSDFNGKIRINTIPFKSKSYFMLFSKKSAISKLQRKKIWEEIKKIRENDALMKTLLEKY